MFFYDRISTNLGKLDELSLKQAQGEKKRSDKNGTLKSRERAICKEIDHEYINKQTHTHVHSHDIEDSRNKRVKIPSILLRPFNLSKKEKQENQEKLQLQIPEQKRLEQKLIKSLNNFLKTKPIVPIVFHVDQFQVNIMPIGGAIKVQYPIEKLARHCQYDVGIGKVNFINGDITIYGKFFDTESIIKGNVNISSGFIKLSEYIQNNNKPSNKIIKTEGYINSSTGNINLHTTLNNNNTVGVLKEGNINVFKEFYEKYKDDFLKLKN